MNIQKNVKQISPHYSQPERLELKEWIILELKLPCRCWWWVFLMQESNSPFITISGSKYRKIGIKSNLQLLFQKPWCPILSRRSIFL